ncbi:hypothetical protein L2E82_06356 [Cichorium intybus]|uniref:Uncharacterized protein n=1 Tax=Cichorium intybus TaxID=13427 RepID=A0ACB9HB43_CICIN|nr:hypothetical protein L2E82_06356 [Cichorium intybus]
MCGASFHPSRISARCIGEDDFIFDSAVMDSEDVYAVNEHPLIVCKLAKPVTLHRHLCFEIDLESAISLHCHLCLCSIINRTRKAREKRKRRSFSRGE